MSIEFNGKTYLVGMETTSNSILAGRGERVGKVSYGNMPDTFIVKDSKGNLSLRLQPPEMCWTTFLPLRTEEELLAGWC